MFIGHFGVAFAARRDAHESARAHKPDLPLYPGDAHLHGLGLWNSMPVTLALEAAVFAGGVYLYMASTRARLP